MTNAPTNAPCDDAPNRNWEGARVDGGLQSQSHPGGPNPRKARIGVDSPCITRSRRRRRAVPPGLVVPCDRSVSGVRRRPGESPPARGGARVSFRRIAGIEPIRMLAARASSLAPSLLRPSPLPPSHSLRPPVIIPLYVLAFGIISPRPSRPSPRTRSVCTTRRFCARASVDRQVLRGDGSNRRRVRHHRHPRLRGRARRSPPPPPRRASPRADAANAAATAAENSGSAETKSRSLGRRRRRVRIQNRDPVEGLERPGTVCERLQNGRGFGIRLRTLLGDGAHVTDFLSAPCVPSPCLAPSRRPAFVARFSGRRAASLLRRASAARARRIHPRGRRRGRGARVGSGLWDVAPPLRAGRARTERARRARGWRRGHLGASGRRRVTGRTRDEGRARARGGGGGGDGRGDGRGRRALGRVHLRVHLRIGELGPGSGRARRPSIWVPPAQVNDASAMSSSAMSSSGMSSSTSRRRCRSRRGRRASWSRRSRDAIGNRVADVVARPSRAVSSPAGSRASWSRRRASSGLGSRSRRARVRLARRLSRAWTTTNGRAPTFGCQFLDAPLRKLIGRRKGLALLEPKRFARNGRSRPDRPRAVVDLIRGGRSSASRFVLVGGSYDAHLEGDADAPPWHPRDVRGARRRRRLARPRGDRPIPRADPVPRADRASLARVAPRLGIAFLLLALLLGGALVRAVVSARAGRARLSSPARRPADDSSPTPRRARDARLSGRRGTPASSRRAPPRGERGVRGRRWSARGLRGRARAPPQGSPPLPHQRASPPSPRGSSRPTSSAPRALQDAVASARRRRRPDGVSLVQTWAVLEARDRPTTVPPRVRRRPDHAPAGTPGRLRRSRRPTKARRLFEARRADPHRPSTLQAWALLEAEQRRFTQAQTVPQATVLDPTHAPSWQAWAPWRRARARTSAARLFSAKGRRATSRGV